VFGIFLPKTGSVAMTKELNGTHEYNQTDLMRHLIAAHSLHVLRGYLASYHRHYRELLGCSADINTAYAMIGPELCDLFPNATYYMRHRNVFQWIDSMVSHMGRHSRGKHIRQGITVGFKWLFRDHGLLLDRAAPPWAADEFVSLLANVWCAFEADIAAIRKKCHIVELEMDFQQIAYNRGKFRSDVYTSSEFESVILHEMRDSRMCRDLSLAPYLVASPKHDPSTGGMVDQSQGGDVSRVPVKERLASRVNGSAALLGVYKRMSTSGDYWWQYWRRDVVTTQSVLDKFSADFARRPVWRL
jgi:hypothetical protein